MKVSRRLFEVVFFDNLFRLIILDPRFKSWWAHQKSKPSSVMVGVCLLSVTLSNAQGFRKVCRQTLHIFNSNTIRLMSWGAASGRIESFSDLG